MKLSIVIPIFNEEQVIPVLHQRLVKLLNMLEQEFNLQDKEREVVLVNDGSTDNSLALLISLAQQNIGFKAINLSRNFGHQIAVTAGMDAAEGEAVVLMDADLQDPPEFILDLYRKYKEGFDVVFAIRKKRKGESLFKLWTAKLFYRIIRKMTNIDIPLDTGDFRIMDRRIVDQLKSMSEKHRFIRGMVTWIGLRQTGIEYERQEREAGKTKYPLFKMIGFAWDAITAFSSIPLRLVSYLGFLVAFVGFTYSLFVIYAKFFTNETVPGWSSVMIVILYMSGINLITLGVVGEYIGRINEQGKNRPLYVVDKVYTKKNEGLI